MMTNVVVRVIVWSTRTCFPGTFVCMHSGIRKNKPAPLPFGDAVMRGKRCVEREEGGAWALRQQAIRKKKHNEGSGIYGRGKENDAVWEQGIKLARFLGRRSFVGLVYR